MVLNVLLEPIAGVAGGVALLTGAPPTQVVPGIDSALVTVVPGKVDGVITRLGNFDGAHLWLEHLQRSSHRRSGLIRLTSGFLPLLVTSRTGTGVAQISEGIGALVTILPADFHGGAAGSVDLDRGGLDCAHDA